MFIKSFVHKCVTPLFANSLFSTPTLATFRQYCDPLGVDRAKVGVIEETDEVGLMFLLFHRHDILVGRKRKSV